MQILIVYELLKKKNITYMTTFFLFSKTDNKIV